MAELQLDLYTFVDSGALTLGEVTVNHADELGLQLSGTANSVNMSTVTFDFAGTVVSSGSSNYITARSLSSDTSFYAVIFNNTWSSATATNNNNVWVSTETALYWRFIRWDGARGGENFDREDPSTNKVVWNSTGVVCGSTVTSVANGNWSAVSTWDIGAVPTLCTPVLIAGGTSVTVDISTAVASSMTVNGTLQFSPTVNTQLVQGGGNLTINSGGWLSVGSPASPIQPGTTAQLVLSSGNVGGQFGLTVNDGGNFTVVGTTRTPWTTGTNDRALGNTSVNVVTPITGWSAGDIISVDTEAVTITSISGGTVNFTPGLGQPHYHFRPDYRFEPQRERRCPILRYGDPYFQWIK